MQYSEIIKTENRNKPSEETDKEKYPAMLQLILTDIKLAC